MAERTVSASVADSHLQISVRITRDATWAQLWEQAGRIIAAAEGTDEEAGDG